MLGVPVGVPVPVGLPENVPVGDTEGVAVEEWAGLEL